MEELSFYAILAYAQCGIWMGFTFVMPEGVYDKVHILPIVTSAVTSLVVGILLTVIRNKCKQAVYIHFYLMSAGSLLMLINGIIHMDKEGYPSIPVYFGGIGHGMVFASGMCYIFLRSAPKKRSVNIASSNLMYIVGLAAMTQALRIDSGMVYLHGLFQTIASGLTLLILLFNELLGKVIKLYNYEKSMDLEFEYENARKDNLYTALLSKQEPPLQSGWLSYIQGGQMTPAVQVSHNQFAKKRHNYQTVLTFAAIFTKITNIILFQLGIMFITRWAISLSGAYSYDFLFLFIASAAGAMLVIPLTIYVSGKFIYVGGVIVYSVLLLVASILFENWEMQASAITFHIFYGVVGLCYYSSNLFLLEVANIRYTEVIFSIGIVVELISVWVSNYLLEDKYIYDINSFMWTHTITFMVLSVTLAGVIILVLYPVTLNRSILEIQHIILYKDFRIRAVPTPYISYQNQPTQIYPNQPNQNYQPTQIQIPRPKTESVEQRSIASENANYRYPSQVPSQWYPQQRNL